MQLSSIIGMESKRRGDDLVVVDLRSVDANRLSTAITLLQTHDQLSELFLPGEAVNEDAIECLSKLPSLRRLRVYGATMDDVRAVGLSRLTKLEAITLQDTSVTDIGARSLASMPMLREVSLMNSPVTDAVLDSLSRSSKLTKLRLRGTQITGASFEAIAVLPIVDLELSETNFGSAGMKMVAALPGLQKLNLWMTKVDDSGIQELTGNMSLRSLNLDNCSGVTDRSIEVIASIGGLKFLHIGGTSIMPDALTGLASLGELETLIATRLRVDALQAESLRMKLPRLKKLEY